MHANVMADLKGRLHALLEDIPRGSKIAFVDYPVYFNVGDLLIDRGTQAFFASYRHCVLGRFSLGDLGYRREGAFIPGRSIHLLDAAVRAGATIVCQGGGNMGDIWPEHQLCREMLIERYREAKIIILPQSVHFSSQAAADRAAELMRRHEGLSLYVRDEPSLKFAQTAAARARLMPDMAHQLWATIRPSEIEDVEQISLRVVRRDSESSQASHTELSSFDWDDIITTSDRAFLKVFQGVEFAGPLLRRCFETYPLWASVEDRLIARAVNVFSRHTRIVTDRLHAMILGALLSRTVEFRDNSYGKTEPIL
ncbi:polysaccharide pyruvyl transferase family protein [Bradyrhizobium ottawaense]|uniref:polysaccharide pyruvyl transferase family protein n=1 Tax=Bradyrhizobium ottawaense TaxID=931866 RepID=UPI00351177A2